MKPAPTTSSPTGDLDRLLTWWREHGPEPQRRVAWIVDPADGDSARTAVDRAVDSGATIIALLGLGNDRDARATIAKSAKVTPVEVRDQPGDMTDIEWMREVAAIRDIRNDEDSQQPGIAAAAAVLTAAKNRGTPVIFDGLVAYAGAMLCGAFDASWMPASTSTNPAIKVAQQYWRVEPAADLKLRGDDDLGIRAVLALLDVVESD